MDEDSLMARPSSSSSSSSSRSGAISSAMGLSSFDFQASIGRESNSLARSAEAIDSSNRGFQLLKKHGWKEGTGLGVFEQGRLEPVEAHLKNNKRGLGADRGKKKVHSRTGRSDQNDENEQKPPKKTKALSKKMRKLQEQEQRLQEKEFERAFFREFWPDNV
ncbi:uncharacterized protein LOC115680808 isoform X2 [Syzygium oleosum]|uniref:uncharacterized protein LOC115680808 isoform X2 n=1 Tax=Syzygium oleosum TaxID=219896 RepID=UPI0024BA52B0|nr:uncharacterized protein LOC115680808 isoform X2 [Syzygium oleosum]